MGLQLGGRQDHPHPVAVGGLGVRREVVEPAYGEVDGVRDGQVIGQVVEDQSEAVEAVVELSPRDVVLES